MQYRLRTLLIVSTIGPLALAGMYWGWHVRTRWHFHDGKIIYLPNNTPGYHWKPTAQGGIIEVPNEKPVLMDRR
jgi:hypothetical protein